MSEKKIGEKEGGKWDNDDNNIDGGDNDNNDKELRKRKRA